MVAISQEKIAQDYIQQALQEQANGYQKTIRLCKFVFCEEIITLAPGPVEDDDLVRAWRNNAISATSGAETRSWGMLIERYQQRLRLLKGVLTTEAPDYARMKLEEFRLLMVQEAQAVKRLHS